MPYRLDDLPIPEVVRVILLKIGERTTIIALSI